MYRTNHLFSKELKVFKERPNIFCLRASAGDASYELNAFDMALFKAGVGNMNLLKVSSILPPYCEYVEKIKFEEGSLIPVAYGAASSSIRGELLSAAVACAIPKDKSKAGLIMEYATRGKAKEDTEKQVREMALKGMQWRGYTVEKIMSISCEHRVEKCGAAFACVVLGWK